VDGENLRHSICDLFHDIFDRNDYLPKSADWGGLFDWLVEQIYAGSSRVRTYWYVVDYLDLIPYLPFPKTKDSQEKMLCRHAPFKTELAGIPDKPTKDARIDSMLTDLQDTAKRIGNRFDGWRKIQDGIMAAHDAIEFRRAGSIKYTLFERSFIEEKAVDVKLATDLIVLRDIYDVAIIVSGDQDYVPAVQVVKDSGKRVVNVSFETRGGKLLPGGARRLNHVTDRAFPVPYADLKAHLKL